MDNTPSELDKGGHTEKMPLVQNPFTESPKINHDYGTGMNRYHSRESSTGSSSKPTSHMSHFHHDLLFEQGMKRRIICAIGLCLSFIVAEIIGAGLSNSLALSTDVLLFSNDFAYLLIALLAISLVCSPPSGSLRSTWYRPEVIVALVVTFVVWVASGILVFEAVLRVPRSDFQVDNVIMLVMVSIAILVTAAMIMCVHVPPETKDNNDNNKDTEIKSIPDEEAGGDDEEAEKVRTKLRKILQASFDYLLYKSFQKVFLFTCSMVLWYHPTMLLADGVNAITISILNISITVFILRRIINVILDSTPSTLDINKVKAKLSDIGGVKNVHHLKFWSIDMTMVETAASVHLAVKEEKMQQQVMEEASRLLHDGFGVEEVTIQMEVYYSGMENHDCPL